MIHLITERVGGQPHIFIDSRSWKKQNIVNIHDLSIYKYFCETLKFVLPDGKFITWTRMDQDGVQNIFLSTKFFVFMITFA